MLEELMRICLPVGNENGLDSVVFGHFGSAPFFAMYDTITREVSFVNNDESAHVHGSCMPVDALRKNNAEAVLCKGMGMRAANLLLEAGITPYLVEAETVAEAISHYDARKVKVLDAASACRSHNCH